MRSANLPMILRRIIFLGCCCLPFAGVARAQHGAEQPSVAIEDNSFFVEEAFNQEQRVVQHIFNVLYYRRPFETTVATFTQEWPLIGVDHQLSYTLVYAHLSAPAVGGMGDLYLNYRYQLSADSSWAAVAPRLSIIFPTGNAEEGLGMGVVGFQVNCPVSRRLSDGFITHWNAGMTVFPGVRGTDAGGRPMRRTLPWYNCAASIIWLAAPTWNLMLEATVNSTADLEGNGGAVRSTEIIISPGFRLAVNLEGLQIVPGIALPVSFVDGEGRVGAFLYLSFEHPY